MKNIKSLSNSERKEFALLHYKNWQRSGLTKSEYCRENNLKTTTFTGWKRYLKIEENNKLTEIPTKTVTDLIPIETGLELKLGNSFSITINQNFNPDLLKRVLKTLGAFHEN